MWWTESARKGYSVSFPKFGLFFPSPFGMKWSLVTSLNKRLCQKLGCGHSDVRIEKTTQCLLGPPGTLPLLNPAMILWRKQAATWKDPVRTQWETLILLWCVWAAFTWLHPRLQLACLMPSKAEISMFLLAQSRRNIPGKINVINLKTVIVSWFQFGFLYITLNRQFLIGFFTQMVPIVPYILSEFLNKIC